MAKLKTKQGFSLIEALVCLVIIGIGFVAINQLLGIILITVKPLPVIPPGQIAAYVLFPITLVAFLSSIRQAK